MELRRFSLCLAFLLVAVISHSSEARLSRSRREASDDFYQDDGISDNENELNDEAGDEDGDSTLENITIITKPESYNVPAEQGVRLECRLDTASPDAKQMVHWKKGNVTLIMLGASTLDANKYTLNGTDLVIKNLTAADSGAYQCSVEGQKPQPMIEHRVTVTEPPKITALSATDDGKPVHGSDLTLTCTATGKPTPKILWSKVNDTEDTMNGRLGEGASITLTNVKEKDSGRYLCYAMANKTADAKGIDIAVQKKHHLRKTIVNSAIGIEAFMQCSVHGEGPVTITWYKGDKPLPASLYTTQGPHSNLTVVPQSDADFGSYICQAESEFGTHKRSTVLVERPVVEGLESEGPKLAWTVHSHQPLKSIEIQLLDLENGTVTILPVPVPDHKTHEYDLTYVVDSSLVKAGNYGVVVKVENTKGVGENIDQIVFEQLPPAETSSSLDGRQLPGAAHAHHPTTALISTVLMYLLVRMM